MQIPTLISRARIYSFLTIPEFLQMPTQTRAQIVTQEAASDFNSVHPKPRKLPLLPLQPPGPLCVNPGPDSTSWASPETKY
jgi:hypothetical protein